MPLENMNHKRRAHSPWLVIAQPFTIFPRRSWWQILIISGASWGEQESGLQWLGGAGYLQAGQFLSKYSKDFFVNWNMIELSEDPPELPAMSMWEYFSGWLLFAWCLSNPATWEQGFENNHLDECRNHLHHESSRELVATRSAAAWSVVALQHWDKLTRLVLQKPHIKTVNRGLRTNRTKLLLSSLFHHHDRS